MKSHTSELSLDENAEWLLGVRRVHSANWDERPSACEPDLIVIHSISLPEGHFGTPHVEALFCNSLDIHAHESFAEIAELKVSAHAFIGRDGRLVQFVPFSKRAWHAGVSCHAGRECCNDFSIGIELEGCDWQAFEEPQYRQLAALVRLLMAVWPAIDVERIVGHSDIAAGRKTDPGPLFDWHKLYGLL